MTRTAIMVIMVVALCATCLIVTAVYSYSVLDRFPNSADEQVYLFQAETLAQGRLWNPTHPLQPFFSFRHIAERDGKWVGRFPPGWPALLASAGIVGIPPWLVNPILGALSLWVLMLLARQVAGPRAAMLTAASVLASAFFVFNGASYFSHMPALLFTLLFYHHGIRHIEQGRTLPALLSGLSVGCAFLIRPYSAVLLGLPLAICFLISVPWRQYVRGLWFVAGAAPGFLLYLLYNRQITGDPFLPVTIWADPREGIGFVGAHTLTRGLEFAGRHLADFASWSSPAVLLLLLPALFVAVRAGNRWAVLSGSLFVVTVLGHLLYRVFGGNQYGPRFYFEAYPFAVLAVVCLLYDEKLKPAVRRGYRILFAAGVAYALIALPIHTAHERLVVSERTDLLRLVRREKIDNAIVLLARGTGVLRPMPILDLTRNDVDLRNEVLYGRDFGVRRNQALRRAFPGRRFYRYTRESGETEGVLEPL